MIFPQAIILLTGRGNWNELFLKKDFFAKMSSYSRIIEVFMLQLFDLILKIRVERRVVIERYEPSR